MATFITIIATAIPAPLVAIVGLTVFAVVAGVSVPTVGDEGALPSTLPFLGIPAVPLTLGTLTINAAGGYTYVAWNQVKIENGKQSPSAFADKRVRQAMTLSVALGLSSFVMVWLIQPSMKARGIPPSSPDYLDELIANAWSLELLRLYLGVVLLVVPVLDDSRARMEPLRVHAGGIVWSGRHLHVAATARGLHTFHVDDIVAVPVGAAPAPRLPRFQDDPGDVGVVSERLDISPQFEEGCLRPEPPNEAARVPERVVPAQFELNVAPPPVSEQARDGVEQIGQRPANGAQNVEKQNHGDAQHPPPRQTEWKCAQCSRLVAAGKPARSECVRGDGGVRRVGAVRAGANLLRPRVPGDLRAARGLRCRRRMQPLLQR